MGMDSDTDGHYLSPLKTRTQLNCRGYQFGEKSVVTKVKGNTEIPYTQPEGTNITIGAEADESMNRIYFANYNSNGFHTWWILNTVTNNITKLLQSITDTNGIDIFRWDPSYRIMHIDIVDHNLLYWTDWGLNKARKFNITKAQDKTTAGYGPIIIEDYVTSPKLPPIYAPSCAYFTDITRNNNEVFGLLFKFVYRYIYDDGEISNYSDYSLVPKPINQSYLGISAINTDNNAISVQLNTGSKLVVKIEVAVQINSLSFQTCAVLHKEELGLSDNSNYTYTFYNDTANTATDPEKIIRPYSFLPDRPKCQSKTKDAMTYTNFQEGWPVVAVNAAIALTYNPIYLPDEEADALNNPQLDITETSHFSKSAGFLSGHYIVNVTHFIVGSDVKAGNTFRVNGSNGKSDNLNFSYTATLADNAVSIGNKIKTWLRGLGRGVPDLQNGVSGESLAGGDSAWDYTYLGHYDENKTTFTGSVNAVNVVTLKDNGISINLIQDGNTRNYAFMYEDDDERKSLGYTSPECQIYTPFRTEPGVGDLLQPIHTISVMHQPPPKARWWQLVRTSDNQNTIELLIQQVITVQATATDSGSYLDLVVGSLFTFQKIHPNTILQFTFEKGQRLRFIKDEVAQTLYPYYETEILSYSIDTEEQRNSAIVTTGSDHVTPSDGVVASYVGKNIQIAGYERNIIGFSGSDYVLDYPINVGQIYGLTTYIVPNYTFVDRRGIVRIKQPTGVTLNPFSLVQMYTPQKNTNDSDYRIFQICGQKYEVSNYGTVNAAHRGNLQDQDGTSPASLIATPAIVQVSDGEVYIRFREMPTNNQATNAQVIVDHIRDPNYSDFYESNLTGLGLPIPQDNGAGVVNFPDRVRFSNNYIQDTQINGLNDFDNLDREDYNDQYGDTQRTLCHSNRLYLFKELKDCWTPLLQSILVDNSGRQLVATSSKLLNQIQYMPLECGIGNNPESLIWDANYIYHASVNFGAFIRIAGDGQDPISTIYDYDKDARALLVTAGKYNLPLIPGIDRTNKEVMWTLPSYIPYIYSNDFDPASWSLFGAAVPMGTTWVINTQPANSAATIVSGLFNIVDTGVLGDDFLTYHAVYPDTTTGPVKKFCFTVVAAPPVTPAYRAHTASIYCRQLGGQNDGTQGYTELEGYNPDTGAYNHTIMPNIQNITPQAIIPDSNTITYHQTGVSPSGGSNGDIWYNEDFDQLYKKIAGVWTLLFGRSANDFYVAPVTNTTACPLPPPTAFYTAYARYGGIIDSIDNGTCTGTPASLHNIFLNNATLSVVYSAIGAGTVILTLDGMPALPGHVNVNVYVNGVSLGAQPFTGPGFYSFTFTGTTTSPTPILATFETHS